MGFIKWLVWTCFSIGLGIFLASYEVGGRTLVEHAQGTWAKKGGPSKLAELKKGVAEAIDEAKAGASSAPKDQYTREERAEVNKLLGRRAGGRAPAGAEGGGGAPSGADGRR